MKRRKFLESNVGNKMYMSSKYVCIYENDVKELAACPGVSFFKVDDIKI